MGDDEEAVRARIAAVHGAYEGLWADFLRNRLSLAEERAAAWLRVLDTVPQEFLRQDADLSVAEADFSYILGAARGNDTSALTRALACYDRTLSLPDGGSNVNARRMRAETLLRLHRYGDAFAAMEELAHCRATPAAWEELEAAPFRLRHDAALCERLARLGRLDSAAAKEAAEELCRAATAIEARESVLTTGRGRRLGPRIEELGADEKTALKRGLFDQLLSKAPYPIDRLELWKAADPVNSKVDWARAQEEYTTQRITVIDSFFTDEALAELWTYAREAPCFRTVRAGYLGAFPADGTVHPIIMETVLSLERRMPSVLAGHPLGLWWLFKYTGASPTGIGIHADAAAVNFNIWLTPDEARRSGGGLDVFMKVPPNEADVSEFNRDFATPEEEAKFRAVLLEAGGVTHVDYKQNRAVMFVSDLFHESEPFEFFDPEEQPRVNLTLLFGDRAAGRAAEASPAKKPRPEPSELQDGGSSVVPGGAKAAEPDWDLFD